jgi:predicted transcriptional regulator
VARLRSRNCFLIFLRNKNMTITTSFLKSTLDSYSAYPAPIRHHLLKAETNPLLKSLFPKSQMRVLIDILGRTPIRDSARAIKLRVDRTAENTSRSEKTVQRVLNALKSKNWITRSDDCDGRNYRGRFSGREFLIGNELREILGLPIEQEMSDGEMNSVVKDSLTTELSTNSVDKVVKKTEMSDGLGVNDLKEVSLKEAFHEETEKQKTGLPQDLIPLQTELGLSKGGICKLMSLAKACGKRLQDIWLAKKSTILNAGVTAGRAFFYIKAIILASNNLKKVSLGKNFFPDGNISRQSKDFRQFWHKRFTGENGVRVKIFDGIAEVSGISGSLNDYRCVPSAQMQPIYEAILSGKLKLILE